MLTIHSINYTEIYADGLRLALGMNFLWSHTFYDYIYRMIYYAPGGKFSSMDAMIQQYLSTVRPKFGLRPLTIQPAWLYTIPSPNNSPAQVVAPVMIRMTGRRDDDELQANNELFRRYGMFPPAGYTWHHVEKMWYRDRQFYCYMCLVKTSEHSTRRHYGAVNEYKWIYAVGYR